MICVTAPLLLIQAGDIATSSCREWLKTSFFLSDLLGVTHWPPTSSSARPARRLFSRP